MNWMQCMDDALRYLEDHLTDEIDLGVAAQKAGCSVYNLQRIFSFLVGQSPSEYIRGRRLTLAAEELHSTNGRILDIAVKYGYESQEAFARAFLKFHGVTPSAARKLEKLPSSCGRVNLQMLLHRGDENNIMNTTSHMLTRVQPDPVFYRGVKGPGTLLFPVSLWSYFEFIGQNHDPARTYALLAALSGDAFHAGISLPTTRGMSRALEALRFHPRIFTTDPKDACYLDEATAKQEIVQSIAVEQRPVIVCNLDQACFGGVIIGYEQDGDTLINWGYYPFDDRDRPEPILVHCTDWYHHATHIVLLGERGKAPELKELYLTGLKGAYDDLRGADGITNESFYEKWKVFLRLGRQQAMEEVRRTGRVPGTWGTIPAGSTDEDTILAKVKEIIDPLWCDFAERRFFAAHFIRQAKEYAPDVVQQHLDRASAAFLRIHDLMYEYINAVGLKPGGDVINEEVLFDPAVQEQLCRMIDECKALELEAINELRDVVAHL